ncbi:hypothetical protein [Oryzobacter terrae]|uniref:hypothetical protein n=1 Tax=Oryzobacter terrae TaxID=1620385 RepID=UPI00366B9EFF
MNDTTVIGSPRASDADVLDYVGAVRAWLGDLPQEEVDDLTAGMQADLAERAAESGARLGDLLGEPEAYASELRAAAGLPPRAEGSRYGVGTRRGVVAEVAVALRAAGARTLTRSPWLRDLRPVWWVARGVALGGVVAAMLGGGRFLLMVLGASLSFWAGRVIAAREVRSGPGTFLAVVNVVAALALVPVAVWVLDSRTEVVGSAVSDSGVWVNGGSVSNLYVYDAAGQRVPGARVFDQFGQPVSLDPSVVTVVTGPDGEATAWPPDTVTLSVFPVRGSGSDAWSGEPESWVPPLSISPLPEQVAPSPSPSPSEAPSSGASGPPSPSASPTPSTGSSTTPGPTATP